MTLKQNKPSILSTNSALSVGIIGGGVAGSTIAIRLAALGVQTYLFEAKSSLVDGPPMCHLHAGGNLYREIPDADCIELLKQSIDMLRLYPYSIDVRPTIITVPLRDEGHPADLLPRLELLTQVYHDMVQRCPKNKVLGEPKDYYKLYSHEALKTLANRAPIYHDSELYDVDDWVANAAKQIDLDKLKYPVIAVMEYGWNIFRLAASAQEALSCYPNAQVKLNTNVIGVAKLTDTNDFVVATDSLIATNSEKRWQINYITKHNTSRQLTHDNTTSQDNTSSTKDTITVDYLINACGFRTGVIDNMIGVATNRMVEFKASYIAHWNAAAPEAQNDLLPDKVAGEPSLDTLKLPEIIFHGKRGTPQGMVQLTPYPDGYYQIHSMDKEVTLFNDGLVATVPNDSQPKLKSTYLQYIDTGWDKNTLHSRSQKAISQVSEFVPRFASAKPTDNALYGGQQIPGQDDTLRVADISLYPDIHYARAENVKASSALLAADDVVLALKSEGLLTINPEQEQVREWHQWAYLSHIDKSQIDQHAKALADRRNFPVAMSGVVTSYKVSN